MLATSPSMQLFSTSSAFGPLSELSSRRTFAYMIATLNASHPHYDFSHVLRPNDFKRERNLRRVMGNLDSILQNVRPSSSFEPSSLNSSSLGSDSNPIWGPQCWSLIDKEMRLNECTVFAYNPETDPFEEDASAIWACHYFFFNRALKRVAYLYVRVVPVVSSHSPTLRPQRVAQHHGLHQGHHRGSVSGAGGHGGGLLSEHGDLNGEGAEKRASYWLGDRGAQLVVPPEEDDDAPDDGLYWNRGEDGDLVSYSDDDYVEGLDDDDDDFDDDDEDMLDTPRERFMSEDVAGRMEI